jgi:hypothetical protein
MCSFSSASALPPAPPAKKVAKMADDELAPSAVARIPASSVVAALPDVTCYLPDTDEAFNAAVNEMIPHVRHLFVAASYTGVHPQVVMHTCMAVIGNYVHLCSAPRTPDGLVDKLCMTLRGYAEIKRQASAAGFSVTVTTPVAEMTRDE